MSFNFNIEENIISVNSGDGEWNLELNLISWGNREPKYDIRKWSPDHEKMSKGITISEDEAILFFQRADDFLDRFRKVPKNTQHTEDDLEDKFNNTEINEISDLPFD